jgi:hypothetical protein
MIQPIDKLCAVAYNIYSRGKRAEAKKIDKREEK